MSETIVALLGILVGGVLTGAMDLLVARQQRANAAKAGARILLADLYSIQVAFEAGRDKQDWWIEDLPLASWEKYRDTLAAHVSADDFHTVSGAFYRAEMGERLRRRGDSFPTGDAEEDVASAELALVVLGRAGMSRREWRKLPSSNDDGA